jgi:hypothetical protein
LTLACVALAMLPRPAAARSSHDCPPPPAGVAALAPAPEHCHHAQSGPCGDMLGCLATPPAMLAASAGVRLLAVQIPVPAAPAAALHGRLALGPPTPPPNS